MALLKSLPTSSTPAPSNPQPKRQDPISSYVSEKRSGGKSSGLLSKLASATDKAREKAQSWLDGDKASTYNKSVSEYNDAVKNVRDLVNSDNKGGDYISKLAAAQDRARQASSNLQNVNLHQGNSSSLNFGDRVVETMLGATKKTGASYVDLARAGMEKGAPTRIAIDTERMQKLDAAAKKATDDYNIILRDVKYNQNDPRVIAAKEKMDNAVDFANRYRGGVERDQSFDERAAAKADELSASADQNINRAKEGAGFLGRLAVDAGVAGTQLATDAAINAMTGIPTLALVGARSFGGGTQQARLEGANIDQQMAYGAANAAVEMLTEKMADGLAGITGKGAADDVAEEVIRKLASTDAGRTALRTVYGMLGEGAEEFISTAVDPALKSIYDEGEAMQESYRTSEGRKNLLSDALYDALVGAALAVPGSAGSIITGQNAQKNAELRARDAQASMPTTSNAAISPSVEQAEADQTAMTGTAESVSARDNELRQMANQLVSEILATGRVNSTTANTILNTPSLRAAAADQTGINFDGMTTDQARTALQRNARAGAYLSSQVGTDATAMADSRARAEAQIRSDTEARLQAEAEAKTQADRAALEEEAVRNNDSNYDSYIRGVLMSGADVATAKEIIDDPVLLQVWERLSGKRIPRNRDGAISRNNAVRMIQQTRLDSVDIDVGNAIERYIAERNAPPQTAPEAAQAQEASPGEITQSSPQTDVTAQAVELNSNPTPTAEVQSAETVTAPTTEAPVETVAQPANPASAPANVYSGRNSLQSGNAGTVDTTNGSGPTVNRGFGENVATDYNMEEPIRQSFQEDPGTYRQLTNAETLEKARAIFDANPEEARNTVVAALAEAKAGRKLAPEMVPLARMVANNLSRQGNTEAASVILSDVAVELTAAGQLGQAARILRDADPNTALKTIQKALDRINQEARNKGLNWQAELTPEEMRLIETTDFTQEGAYERVYDEISRRVGAEMPSTIWDKLTEVRRINMLLRPRTLVKNIASNVPMVGVRKMAEGLSAAIQEQMVRSGRMDASERTRARADAYDRQLANDYFDTHSQEILESGNKWDLNTMLRQNRTIFKDTLLKNSAVGEAVSKMTGQEVESFGEALRQVTYWALEQGDNPFVKSAFVDSLAQYCAAQGITDQSQITQDAIDFATANAMEATFKATNVVAKAINSLKNDSSPAVSAALDILLPFTTTPANIMNLMGQYSPLGFARLLSKSGKYSLADKVDIFSKASTGTALMALGFALRSLGMITGGEDDDKDKAALDRATGVGTYSIGGKVSYDWAQPVGSLFALGAEISDAVKGQEGWDSAIMNAVYTAGDSALNMSMFQNILSVLKGTGKPTQQIIDAIMEGGATQLMPGLAGDIAKIIDGTVRSTYTGGNVFSDIGAKLQSSTPFASMLMPESVNVRGETNTRGGFMARLLNQTINPTNYTRGERNDVDEEIYRLYEETGSKTHFPNVSPYKVDYETNSFRMNGKEREQFQKTQGQTYYDLARQAMESEAYNSLSPEQQQIVLGAIGKYALDTAKRELVDSKGILYESDWDDETALNNISEYLSAKQAINDAAKVGGSRRNYQGLDDVLANFDSMSPDTKEKLIEGVDYARKLLYSSRKGVGSEQWFTDHEAVKSAQSDIGKTSDYVSGVAITNRESGKTDAEKLQLLEAQLAPSKDGTRNSTVRGYESAIGYGVPFDTYTAFLENLRKYDADGNSSFNKHEIYNAAGATLKENDAPAGTMAWMLYNSYKKSTADKYDADGDIYANQAPAESQTQLGSGGLLRPLG